MTAPRVTVALATRQSAATLPRALDSVRPFLGDVEVVVVDGASSDGTVDLLRARESPAFRWISEPDRGVYDAMNKALDLARGGWVLFLGSDDALRPEFAEAVARLCDPATVYYGDVWRPGARRLYGGFFDAAELAKRNICQQGIFYPRRAFERRRFDTRYRVQADWAFNMACWSDPALRFSHLGLCVAEFEDRHGLSSRTVDREFNRDYGRLLRAHFHLRDCWKPLIVHALSRAYRTLVREEPLERKRSGLR